METGRVVQADDFGAEEFHARDWTTEPYAEEDPCKRPPRVTVFNPPGLSLSAEVNGDDLIITPVLGAGTYGGYLLFYMVNGVWVAVSSTITSGAVPKTVPMQEAWFEGELIISVRVESALPLPVWSTTARCEVLLICSGMPEGDSVFEISRPEYLAWSRPGTWRLNFSASGGESHTAGGGGGDTFSSPEGAFADRPSELACGFDAVFSGLPVTTEYYGYPSGGVTIIGTTSAAVTINLGTSGGRYYAGVTVVVDSGIADSSSTPGTNLGTFSVSVGGHSVPMETRWSLGYSGYPGYINTILWELELVKVG